MNKKRLSILFSCSKVIALFIVLFSFTEAYAQRGSATGRVTDQQGAPLVGAAVVEKGTNNGTVTDGGGRFSLQVAAGAVLHVSYLGYADAEMPAGTDITITLSESNNSLDEVVVVGYGTVRRGDLTTAVSTVSTEDLDMRPITSASAAIQGRAAGVQVIQPNGAPGSGMVVRIRGASSIESSNDPLYVVDGVPVGEGEYAIAFLSPNDIESMQILKDASSAAIYGSRAANGVVLITTKKGSGNKGPKISFSSFVGVSNVSRTYDVLNVAEYKELMDEMGIIQLPDGLKDETDWFKETYRTGVNQNYQLSYSGGNDNTSYYVGGGYNKEQGVLKVAYNERYNFRTNLETQLRKWIKFGTNINYSHYKNNGIITGQGANRAGVVASVVATPTYAKVWDQDDPNKYWRNFYGANLTTPAENMGRTEYNFGTTDRFVGTVSADINLARDLTFTSSVTMDRRWRRDFEFLDPVRTSYGESQKGSAKDTRSDDRRMIYDNILNYSLSLGKHSLHFMGGTSATVSRWEDLSGERTHFSTQYGFNPIIGLNGGNKGGLRGQSAGISEWAIMSYLGRVTYNYDSKYLLTVNFRADGSSKLAPDYRWGYFPSVSAAWRISGERFMEDVNWVDDLKLRVGWGQSGNQSGIDDYAYIQSYNMTYYDWTNTENADATPTLFRQDRMKNEQLTWETTTQTNVGIDFTLLKGRLTLTLDAYYKYTSNLLTTVNFDAISRSMVHNSGEMSNKGLEVVISSRNFVGSGFNWSTDFNISFNRNKIEKMELIPVRYYGSTSDMISSTSIKTVVGKPLSMFWGYEANGVDPETGLIIYKDLDDNGKITASDKTWIGDANPKFTFGMTNDLSYKGFNLNILVTGSYGNDIFNASRVEMVGMGTASNQLKEVLDRWRVPGQITDVPKSNEPWNNRVSSRWIEDGSYIKIKNITLSYNINTEKLKKINISRIQPYVTLQNFFTFTKYSGYDPEVSQWGSATSLGIDWGTYPHVKTVVFGLNIDF